MDLSKVTVRPIAADEEARYQQLLEHHHYLGAIPKIGQTVRYVALYEGEGVSFSAASLKSGARDRWIGWEARLQFGRLKLIANNSRFLILPQWHEPTVPACAGNAGHCFCHWIAQCGSSPRVRGVSSPRLALGLV